MVSSSRRWVWGMILLSGLAWTGQAQSPAPDRTYAERLGWQAGDRVIVFHVDDAGMSHGSNLGTIQAMDKGVATSCSIMMPCSWVSEYAAHLRAHPADDAGLHLTLTSEWDNYRWGPVAGKTQVPTLTDKEGCLWDNVAQVVKNATPEDVYRELRAQWDRAVTMGIQPTHLDSHMGTLFASPAFMDKYIQLGIETKTPVLFPGGHLQYIREELSTIPEETLRATAQRIWSAGLPVLDDILAATYDWSREEKRAKFIEAIKNMKPGVTEMIVHSSVPTEEFPVFTTSSEKRLGDLEVMCDPEIKKVLEEEKIILTTWRELKQRRDQVQEAVGK